MWGWLLEWWREEPGLELTIWDQVLDYVVLFWVVGHLAYLLYLGGGE